MNFLFLKSNFNEDVASKRLQKLAKSFQVYTASHVVGDDCIYPYVQRRESFSNGVRFYTAVETDDKVLCSTFWGNIAALDFPAPPPTNPM